MLAIKDLRLDISDYSWLLCGSKYRVLNVIIVPGLGIPTDKEALQHIKELFPDYQDRIYQVQMPSIVKRGGGALNCLSWTFTL